MTPLEYRDAIARLGLTQEAAGRFLGLSRMQSSRYANGAAEVPRPVALLLDLMVRKKLKPEDIDLADENISGRIPKSVR